MVRKEKSRYHSLETLLNEMKTEKIRFNTAKSKRDSTITSILLEQDEFDLLGESVDQGFKAWLGDVDSKSALSIDGSEVPFWKDESSMLLVCEIIFLAYCIVG
jgi:hypothetical protein